jgi:signal transduction histidine kinase
VTLARIIAIVRLAIVPLALVKILVDRNGFPDGYETAAWIVLAAHALVAVALFFLTSHRRGSLRLISVLSVLADTVLATAWMFVFAWEPGQPLRSLLFLVVVEAAVFFRFRVGLIAGALTLPILLAFEWWREEQFGITPRYDALALRVLVGLALGGVVGRLVDMERGQARAAEARAAEAERLRDELGRRVDVLEATSRAARALSSSLDLDAAFGAFVQELRGVLRFDRAAILFVDSGGARVMATAGVGADHYLPPGSALGLADSVLEEVVERGSTVYREDIGDGRYPQEEGLYELGVRARVLAPLQLGGRAIGALAISRTEAASFTAAEVELVTLLGRLVATAVQNLRTYEAERATVEELRRLSALRADFVSLVSHELRSPMAAVIGSARTLQQRWRELKPEQREAFLAVIADETTRLSALVGDVLDTSRIEAGTFGYAFTEIDLADVVRNSVAAAGLGQDEVRLTSELPASLPAVIGDATRLRQLVDNLISNAIKYSDSGGEVHVEARVDNGHVVVCVADNGPGIADEHHAQIFEKFGRVVGTEKPGTGLGLFLARSFAEAHGGSLAVESTPGEGAVFTLILPTPGSP